MMGFLRKYLIFFTMAAVFLAALTPVIANGQGAAVPLPGTTPLNLNLTEKSAGGCGWICQLGQWVVDRVFEIITGIVSYLGAALVTLAGYLVNFSFAINLNVGRSPFIQTGWIITRDLANLGFVLAIIIISFATILRLPAYGYKQMLGKLIIAALTINFSLLIANIFIDFSNVLLDFFLRAVTDKGISGLANSMMAAVNPGALSLPVDATAASERYTTPEQGFFVKVVSVFFIAGFLFLTAFSFVALAVMLLIRYVVLTVLLIFVPLAWLSLAIPIGKIPGVGNIWERWWNEFLRWVFFAPIMAFFIYLALLLVTNYPGTVTDAALNASKGIPNPGTIQDFFLEVSRMAVTLALLLGGLFSANAAGITGAKTFYGYAKKSGLAVRGYVGRRASRAASYPLRTEFGRKMTEGLQKTGAGGNRITRAITRPIREFGTTLSRGRTMSEKQQTAAAEKAVTGLSYEELSRRYNTADGPLKLSILSKLGDKDKETGKDRLDLLPGTARDDFARYKVLYGKHETFPKAKRRAKGKTKGGEEVEMELPEEPEEETEGKKPPTLYDQFGRPIT